MAIDPHKSPSSPNGPGYETRDANPVSVAKFGITLGVVLILIAIGMKWMFGYFAQTQTLGPAASPFENARTLPPQPRLQVAPQAEIHNYWEQQHEILKSYAWVDRHNGFVRIPIQRAMELVIQRGLPMRPAASESPGTKESAASPSANSAGGAR